MFTAMLYIAAIVATGELLPPVTKVLIGLYGLLAFSGFIGPIGHSSSAGPSTFWYGNDLDDQGDAQVSFDFLDGDGESGGGG